MSLLSINSSILFVCDIQEKFVDHIHAIPSVIHSTNVLLKTFRKLNGQVILTEQYPKGLGRTSKQLEIGDLKPIEKNCFCMHCSL